MAFRNKLACCIAIAIAGTQTASADDATSNMFSVSGYGTLGLVHSSEDKADFIPLVGPTVGVGHSDSTSARTDTRAAVQIDAKFNDRFSAVAQFVSELDENNTYDPRLAVANLKYQATPGLTFTLGRFIAPFYMLTDFQRTGYAFPWVRPPAEVYNLAFSTDGIMGTYKFNAGSAAVTTQLFYAHGSTNTFDVDGMAGVTAQADIGASTFRVAYMHSSLTIKSAGLDGALAYYRPMFDKLADQWAVRGDSTSFTGVGYAYDPGQWFFRAEATRTTGERDFLAKTTRMYASGGVRLGAFTPYVTLAKVKNDGPLSIGSEDPIGVINAVLSGNDGSHHSFTVGNRWDFHSNLDFKVEFSHVKNGSGSAGELSNVQPGFVPGKAYNLVSATVDFVF
ncbi:MAG TPA: hypothetical protein VF132_00315 [Rudaea sp.]